MAVGVVDPSYSEPFERGMLVYVTSILSALAAVSGYAWWVKRNARSRGGSPPPEPAFVPLPHGPRRPRPLVAHATAALTTDA